MKGMRLGRGRGMGVGVGRGVGLKDGSQYGLKLGGRGFNKTDVCRHPELKEDAEETEKTGNNVIKNILRK